MRTCTKCKVEKVLTEFRRDAKSREGRSMRCRKCKGESDATWQRANPCMVARRNARWRRKHPEQAEAIRVLWAASHPENIRLRKKRWRIAHPDRHAAGEARRKAQQTLATPAWTNHVAVGEFYALAAIKTRLTNKEWEVDHIVPLNSARVCGLHTHYNLQVITKLENSSKGNRRWPDMPQPEVT